MMIRPLFAVVCLLLLTGLSSAEVAIRNGEKVGPSFVKVLTDDNFEHDTQASTGATTGDWFVEFYAPWCGHCQSLSPIWDSLSVWVRDEQIPVSIAKLDATEHVRTAKRFDVRGFPTLKYLSQGKLYDYQGARTIEAFKSFLENREWLKGTAKSMPGEVSAVEFWKDYIRETSNDVVMLLWRKSGGSAVLGFIGLLVGILSSMLVFILFLEKKQNVLVVNLPAGATAASAPAMAQHIANSGSFSASPSPTPAASPVASVPATDAAAKKKE